MKRKQPVALAIDDFRINQPNYNYFKQILENPEEVIAITKLGNETRYVLNFKVTPVDVAKKIYDWIASSFDNKRDLNNFGVIKTSSRIHGRGNTVVITAVISESKINLVKDEIVKRLTVQLQAAIDRHDADIEFKKQKFNHENMKDTITNVNINNNAHAVTLSSSPSLEAVLNSLTKSLSSSSSTNTLFPSTQTIPTKTDGNAPVSIKDGKKEIEEESNTKPMSFEKLMEKHGWKPPRF